MGTVYIYIFLSRPKIKNINLKAVRGPRLNKGLSKSESASRETSKNDLPGTRPRPTTGSKILTLDPLTTIGSLEQ